MSEDVKKDEAQATEIVGPDKTGIEVPDEEKGYLFGFSINHFTGRSKAQLKDEGFDADHIQRISQVLKAQGLDFGSGHATEPATEPEGQPATPPAA